MKMAVVPAALLVAIAAVPCAASSLSEEVIGGLAASARRAGVRGRLPADAAGSTPTLRGTSASTDSPRRNQSLAHVTHHVNVSQHVFTSGFTGRAHARGEQLEKWKDSGKAVQSSLTEAELTKLIAPISGDSYGRMLHEIVDPIPSRFVANPGNPRSADWIKERFAKLGFAVREQAFDAIKQAKVRVPANSSMFQKQGSGNIIGLLEGTDLKDEVVIFGAHYDSVNWQDTSGPAPGVDDNGSGLAGVMMMAEALSAQKAKRPLRRSVAVVAFQAEEEGLLGSTYFVQEAVDKGLIGKPVATVIADEISYEGRPEHKNAAIFETVGKTPENAVLIDTFAHAADQERGISGFEVNYHGFGSDHIPFLDAGYPAVLLIERDNSYHADEWGHSSQDTFEHVNTSFGAAMTRLAVRTVLKLASPKQ